MKEQRPILLQGAMENELGYFKENISCLEEILIHGYTFFKGKLDNYPVVISKTNIGMVNASLATMFGILEFNPASVINQGTAGAHDINLHKNDIVVGKSCININSYKTNKKEKMEGSDPFSWEFLSFRREESGLVEQKADEELLQIAENIKDTHQKGNVFFGRLGSGDVWNKEYDRIEWLNKNYHTLCEDMESINVYTICNKFNIPVVGIRVISNNERLNEEYDRSTGLASQKFSLEVCKELIKKLNK